MVVICVIINSNPILFWGIPPYWFWAQTGFLLSFVCYLLLLYYNNIAVSEHVPRLVPGIIGLAIGAKLFGIITSILLCIQSGDPITVDAVAHSGIVYWGGILGFVAGMRAVYRNHKTELDFRALDLLAICVPFFHAFARVGCFFAGCCFGKIADSRYAVLYETTVLQASYRIPVQLYEAAFEMLVAIYLLFFRAKQDKPGMLLDRYLLFYSVGRFTLEYLRGDDARGVFGIISFSQIICIVVISVCIVRNNTRRKKNI